MQSWRAIHGVRWITSVLDAATMWKILTFRVVSLWRVSIFRTAKKFAFTWNKGWLVRPNYLASQISLKLVVDESKNTLGTVFERAYLHTGVNTAKMKYVFFLRGHVNESCDLIGSKHGQYFPISAHGHSNALFEGIRRLLFAKYVATNDDFPLSASVLTGIWRILIIKCVTIKDYLSSD